MIEALIPILSAGGVALPPEALEKLESYHALLLQWNEKMDLTNVPEAEMPLRHYGDSLLPLARGDWFPAGASLIDVGTGAGFPGMALAIARPDLRVTLLDAQRKRCDFLSAVREQLELENVRILHARAEDAARTELREHFQTAAARAVAPLNVLAEYLLPFVAPGGRALCWKGPALSQELPAGTRAAKLLGGEMEETLRLPIPEREHYVVPIRKMQKTDRRYPRKSGTPTREPLGEAVEKAKTSENK